MAEYIIHHTVMWPGCGCGCNSDGDVHEDFNFSGSRQEAEQELKRLIQADRFQSENHNSWQMEKIPGSDRIPEDECKTVTHMHDEKDLEAILKDPARLSEKISLPIGSLPNNQYAGNKPNPTIRHTIEYEVRNNDTLVCPGKGIASQSTFPHNKETSLASVETMIFEWCIAEDKKATHVYRRERYYDPNSQIASERTDIYPIEYHQLIKHVMNKKR
ncbi:hypothetical protein JW826_01850 [Candidatus Woesearchaeota archaeon]|nr:hypothetical protein [Candidatus Woesearchaeota archaeon]